MYIKQEEYTIPERVIPATTGIRQAYYASDGTYFGQDERACKDYEERQKYEMIRVLRSEINEIENCYEFESEYTARFYYIKDLNDLNDLVEQRKVKIQYNNLYNNQYNNLYNNQHNNQYNNRQLCVNVIEDTDKIDTTYCDFNIYGEGWYIVYWDDMGVWTEVCYCLNWNHYIEQLEKKFVDYKVAVENMMREKEVEL